LKIRYLIANAYATGGTIRTTISSANALAERGHDVEVVSVYKNRNEPAFSVDDRVRMRPLVDRSPATQRAEEADQSLRERVTGPLRRFAEQRASRLIHPLDFRYPQFNGYSDVQLLRFLRSVNDGVLIGTRAGLNLAIARWAKPSVVRIGQEHLHLGLYKGDLVEAIKRYYPRLDAYVTLTSGDADRYRELLGPQARLLTIPNAVPQIKEVQSNCDNHVVLAAGRLTRQKGFDRMIDAYRLVADKHPEWELRIFGAGPLQDDLQKQIDEANLGSQIKLMGFTAQLADEMAAASIFLMTSRFEGFPMVLLEAMKCGLPVVSYDLSNGPRDLITDGVDGVVVSNRKAPALAAAVIDLMEDDQRRTAMGAAAIKKAAEYDIETMATRWEAVFDDLIAARRQQHARRPPPRSGSAATR
jgi:glycosyltransferase involved in cell wall biosynthesis